MSTYWLLSQTLLFRFFQFLEKILFFISWFNILSACLNCKEKKRFWNTLQYIYILFDVKLIKLFFVFQKERNDQNSSLLFTFSESQFSFILSLPLKEHNWFKCLISKFILLKAVTLFYYYYFLPSFLILTFD